LLQGRVSVAASCFTGCRSQALLRKGCNGVESVSKRGGVVGHVCSRGQRAVTDGPVWQGVRLHQCGKCFSLNALSRNDGADEAETSSRNNLVDHYLGDFALDLSAADFIYLEFILDKTIGLFPDQNLVRLSY